MRTPRTNDVDVDGYIKILPAMLDIFWTKSTKLCAMGCPISQPVSEGGHTESSGASVRGLFHKMPGNEYFTISYRLSIGTDSQ